MGSGQDRQDPPPPYSAVAGGDQVSGARGVDVPGNRPLEVHTSQTPDSPAVTPHVSDVPADAVFPETGRSGSVVDSDGGVHVGQPTSPSGMTGRDADSGVDSVAGRGDSHRLDVAAASPDSATPLAEGSQAAPDPHQDPATAVRRPCLGACQWVCLRACRRVCRWTRCGCGCRCRRMWLLAAGWRSSCGAVSRIPRAGLCCWSRRAIRVRVWWCRLVRVRPWRRVWGVMLSR